MSPVESFTSAFYSWDFLQWFAYPIILLIAYLLIKYIFYKLIDVWKLNRMAKYGLDYIDKMDGFQFEMYLKALFKKLGYTPEVTRKTGDYGADLVLKGKNKIVIQAKRYNKKNKVGIRAVQEILGAKEYYNAKEAWVITNSTFTHQARKLAQSSKVKLLDREDLQKFISQINPDSSRENNLAKEIYHESLKDSQPEAKKCPRCGNQLVERVSRKNGSKFMGCSNFPSCRYTESIE